MNVIDTVGKLMTYVREGELCSCPYFIVDNGSPELALFTYFASDEEPTTVFGYGQEIVSKGDSVVCTEKDLFQSESELIVISDAHIVSVEERNKLYNEYYKALQMLFDSFTSVNQTKLMRAVSITFKNIITNSALELYRRICPGFLDYLSI